LHQTTSHKELLLLLQRFWELDAISDIQDHTFSVEDQQCEGHFEHTHSSNSDGRYMVRLPFKGDPSKLGASKSKAVRMVAKMFDKFDVEQIFADLYSNYHTMVY